MVFVNMERLLDKVSATQELRVFSHPSGNGTFSFDSLSQLEKYWKRPLELESKNFATICEDYELDLTSKKVKTGTQSNSQCVGYKKSSAHKVLVISGKQLPDNSSELSPEDEYFYYLTALTLFKPHRKDTLLHLNESVNAAYQSFLTSTSFESISQLRNFEATWLDFYKSQQNDDGNEESAEAELLRTRAPPKCSWWYEPDSLDENELDSDFDDELVDADDFFSMDIDGEKSMTRDLEFVRNDPELRDAVRNTCKAYPISDEIFSPPDTTMEQYFLDLITCERRLAESETMGTSQFLDTFQDARTRLERLTECFEPVPWPNRDRADESLLAECDVPQFPKIAEVSVAYNLNLWQHVMFEMAARHLLFAYLKDIENESKTALFPDDHRRAPYAIKEQLIGFLGGEAGTGKSRVIHAILIFAEKWGRAGTVETIAYTGVAAININGKTMHSSRNLKLGGHGQNAAPTQEMRAKFGLVVLVIIDEISMTDQALLGSTDLASRGMTDTPRRIMGGKHVIFGGDWLQLPPVRGVSGKRTLVPALWFLLKSVTN
ncbi:hypothetical protein BBJ28_00017710 [Nothophytophthora sp. Chile5]|nr:hypothetical protein BBJ28_00017710 [Nothophytophthora sp. Chile5]